MGVVLAACSSDKVTAPAPLPADVAGLFTSSDSAASSIRSAPAMFPAHLPDSLRLTAEQEARVRQLVQSFQASVGPDLTSLEQIMRQADAARRAGKSMDEVRAIMAAAQPILARLHTAQQQLEAAIWDVYTPAQRAYLTWLREQARCRASITPDQQRQIMQLQQAFEAANREDLALERQYLTQLSEAIRSGASREDIQRILEASQPVRDRLAVKRAALMVEIQRILGQNHC